MGKVDRLVKKIGEAKGRGDDPEAYEYANQAISLAPQDGMLYGIRAQAAERLGLLAEAMADWDRAISYFPSDDLLFQRRGDLKSHLEQYQEAIADYDLAIALNPNDALHAESRARAAAALQAAGSRLSMRRMTWSERWASLPLAGLEHRMAEHFMVADVELQMSGWS